MYCLQCFSSIEILDAHGKDCIVINRKQAIKMPNEDENEVEFVNHRKPIPVPFVIDADFEAITKKNMMLMNRKTTVTFLTLKHTKPT